MVKSVIKHGLTASLAIASLVVTTPLIADAQNARAQAAQTAQQRANPELPPQAQANANANADRVTGQEKAAQQRQAAQTKLTDAKLRACENRQESITNIMARLADRGQKQADLFGLIAERTKDFYEQRSITLPNYVELVDQVNTTQAIALATVEQVAADSSQFDCQADDPKAISAKFQASLQSEITALNDYKTAVKNLIVGVKSAQATADSAGTDQVGEGL